MKDAFYFSHDCNARHDPKILALRSVYGMEGYGRYWILIEMLREQSDYRIMLTKYVWNALAMQMQCSASEAEEFVQNCINEFRLFQSDGKAFWSESLFRRMSKKDAKTDQARNAANARWNKGKQDSNNAETCEVNTKAMQTQCGSNAIKEKKEKKEEESKEKNIRAREEDKVLLAYQNNIGVLNDIAAKKLDTLTEMYTAEWVLAAIEEAVMANVRKLGFIESVLSNWGVNGFKTKPWEVDKCERGDKSSHSGGSKQGQRSSRGSPAKSNTDWENEPDTL